MRLLLKQRGVGLYGCGDNFSNCGGSSALPGRKAASQIEAMILNEQFLMCFLPA
jgi:hypothetical protein